MANIVGISRSCLCSRSANLLRLILNRFYEKKFGPTCWFPSRHYCKSGSQSPMDSVKIVIRAKNIVSVFLYESVTEQSKKKSSTVKTIRVKLNKFCYDYLSRIFKSNTEGRAGRARKQFSSCLLIFLTIPPATHAIFSSLLSLNTFSERLKNLIK